MSLAPDPDGLRPEDFPGWYRGPDPSQAGKWGHDLTKGHGHSRVFARNISWHCGDIFARWVLTVCAKREDPWALLRAVNAVLEASDTPLVSFGREHVPPRGHRARTLVAELLAPDEWDEKQMEGRWPF